MQYYGMSRHKISFAQAFISYFITEMIGFCCICLFPRTTSDTKFYFVSLSMQSNVNRIFFMEGFKSHFISGLTESLENNFCHWFFHKKYFLSRNHLARSIRLFPTTQFVMSGFSEPYRLGWGNSSYVRDNKSNISWFSFHDN